ncbi:MAG TPA: hypothetical protein VMR74_12600 [Gammaproteobacteria bacterium]|nr:hypothetical protein [Gammaproteobacteria bacterium]
MNPRRNLAILFAVLGCQILVNVVLGGLAGAALADNRALATLPLSVIVLVSMFVAPLASLMMGRFGRRAGFLLGGAAGAFGGALSAAALFEGSGALACLRHVCTEFPGCKASTTSSCSASSPRPLSGRGTAQHLALDRPSVRRDPEHGRRLRRPDLVLERSSPGNWRKWGQTPFRLT